MIAPSDRHATLADLRAGRLAGATRLDLRHAGLHEVPPEVFALAGTLEWLDLSNNRLEALPPGFERLQRLRVLFASDNRFTALPDALGRCGRLQKLMLAGNRLARLPDPSGWQRLELVRLAANRFERRVDALPAELLALPRLAWIAFGGNPFNAADEARALARSPVPGIAWDALEVGARLGEGASGVIHAATLDGAALAVKLFKGEVTSDGLPASEMAASVAAGVHPGIVGVAGVVAGHPQGARGLVMRRIPPGYRNLAGPPSLASCTRDVYADGLRLAPAVARAIALGVADALAHLHGRGVLHGDLYAHNLLVDAAGHALLGDFGAASPLPADDPALAEALVRLDRRALGVLIDELAARCDEAGALDDLR